MWFSYSYARQLMEDTIRRNASPVRGEGSFDRPDSSSSLNTDSDDSLLPAIHSGTQTPYSLLCSPKLKLFVLKNLFGKWSGSHFDMLPDGWNSFVWKALDQTVFNL